MKRNFIKRIVAFLSVACICVGFASCKLKDKFNNWFDDKVNDIVDSVVEDLSTSDSSSSDDDTSHNKEDSSVGDSSSSDETNVELNKPVKTGLVSPSNETALIESCATALEGASLNMSSARPALRFTVRSSKDLSSLVDEERYPVFIVAPLSVFDKVNKSAHTYVDWYNKNPNNRRL